MAKIFFILLLSALSLFAQGAADWQSITNLNDVEDITISDQAVWAVSGGGMFRFDLRDSTFEKFTNLQGLRSLDLNTVAHDDQGRIIIGGEEGLIQIYDPNEGVWNYDYALQGKPIYDLFVNGDTLWVATRDGAGVFKRNQGTYIFKDFFHNFPIRPGKITQCQVFNGKIWLGTDKGLLSAPSDFGRFTINDPSRWQAFTASHFLPDNYVTALAHDGKFLWVGTKAGLVSVDKQNNFQLRTDWKLLDSGKYLYVDYLLTLNNNLYIAAGISLYTYNPDRGLTGGMAFQTNIRSVDVDENQIIWVGQQNKGIASSKNTQPKEIPGPPVNTLRTVFKDRQNNIWLSGSRPKFSSLSGIIKYDGQQWTQYHFSGAKYWTPANDVDAIYQDRFGNMWFGTWGGGVIVFSAAQDTFFFNGHDFSGQMTVKSDGNTIIRPIDPNAVLHGFFSGAVTDTKYDVITSVVEGPQGNLWFTNYYASNEHLLAVAPFDNSGFPVLDPNRWVYFGTRDGIRAAEGGVLCLAFDTFNNLVYIGTYRDGLYILDYGSSISNKSDDQIYHLQIKDNLFSNFVQSLAVDQDGILWIGTASGLNSFDGINVYKHVGDEMGLAGPLENDIRRIVVDKYNNKWFATSGGVSILRADRSPWDAHGWIGLNTRNSYLVSNDVHDIFVDDEHGEAYIATGEGLSIYRGSFAEIRQDFKEVAVGPNPFIIGKDNPKFVIKNLMQNSTVKIFTINGRMVRELTPKTVLSDGTVAVDGGRAYWDGLDALGKKVASGIYLYLAYTEDGKSTTGKFAVIRK